MSIHENAKAAVSTYFAEKLTPGASQAKTDALNNLYFGPPDTFDLESDEGTEEVIHRTPMPFGKATKVLTNWWDYVGSDVWYDVQSGEVFDREPKGYEDDTGEVDDDGEPVTRWAEPRWEDYVHYDSLDAKRAFFGSELAPHI